MNHISRFAKSVGLMIAMIASSVTLFSQAVLPTSWDFDTPAPTGWTEILNAGNTRYATGFAGTACRLDGTGDYVLVEFAEEPGAVSYYLKGQNSGATWQGTFTVEQSTDGTNFTALRTFSGADLPYAAFTQFTDQPSADAVAIRFYFTNKVSGHNVALDNAAIAAPVAGAAQEINIKSGTTNVPNNSTFVTGDAAATTFTIENLGLGTDLNVTNIAISGADAADFSVTGGTGVVSSSSSVDFTLNFNGTGTGSRFCSLTIDNDDASESPYVINIYAVAGGIATEPTAQASSVTFSGVQSWDYNVTFTSSATADNYLVVRSQGAPLSASPVDNTTYVRGAWLGNGQVVYVGEPATFNARYVEANTTYYYTVYAFNGPAGYENYNTTSPATGNVASDAPNAGTYYSGLDHNAANFVTTLQTKLFPADYFQIFYSNYISTLINEIYVRDTTDVDGASANYVECEYSGFDYIYPASFQWWDGQGPGKLSREHSFPQSWMPTYNDAGFDDSDEVSDQHNLFPVLQVECNAVRSNYPYGEVVTPSNTYLDNFYGANANGQNVYEMRDSFKGDAARAVMYHAAKNTVTGQDFSLPEQVSLIIPYGQDEKVLKTWHFSDMPDNFEIARNEYIETRQNNRNAFIDSTHFPCYIRFSNMTKWQPIALYNGTQLTCVDQGLNYQWYQDGVAIDGATTSTYTPTANGTYTVEMQQFEQCPSFVSITAAVTNVGVEEMSGAVNMVAYPNPSNGQFNLSVETLNSTSALIQVTDMSGRVIAKEFRRLNAGKTIVEMPTLRESGVYMVEITSEFGTQSTRLVVE
ncbi:MAG: endonuclease [Flavobacteriales bacterium]